MVGRDEIIWDFGFWIARGQGRAVLTLAVYLVMVKLWGGGWYGGPLIFTVIPSRLSPCLLFPLIRVLGLGLDKGAQ